MRILRTAGMAFKSILHNKMRSFLTMLGIIIGVCSVITLVSVIQGLQKKTLEQFAANANTISAYYYYFGGPGGRGGGGIDVTDDFMAFGATMQEHIVGITPTSRAYNVRVRYRDKSSENTFVSFASETYDACVGMTLEDGRSIAYSDIVNYVQICVIGNYVKEEYFGLENPIGKKLKIKGVEYEVVGVYKSRYNNVEWSQDNTVVVPMSLQRKVSGIKGFTEFSVKAKSADSTTIAMAQIQDFFQSKLGPVGEKYHYYAYSDNQWIEQENEYITMMSLVVGGIAGISLLVGGIGIMNIMLVSVTERTREIGIRMSIGAKRRDIIGQFLVESAVISTLGGIIGIVLGAVGSSILSAALMKQVFYPSTVIVVGAFLFSVTLGVFFGLYPANKASKLQPVEALRNQ